MEQCSVSDQADAGPPRRAGQCRADAKKPPHPKARRFLSSPGDRHVNGFTDPCCIAPASKPGGDLLFHCLGNSTIGAVWFHGRVRDGIGWVTDAMATKLWGRRKLRGSRNR